MSNDKRKLLTLRAYVARLLRQAVLHIVDVHKARNMAVLKGLPEIRADELFYGKKRGLDS